MFFVRSIFWLSVVFVLLPVAPEDRDKIESISPIEAVGAAAAAVRDITGFCGRNPETCETGGKAAVALGYKAKYGAQQLLSSSSDKQDGENDALVANVLGQPKASLGSESVGVSPTENAVAVAQSAAAILVSETTAAAEEPVISADAIVPASATPATPTPRARPNI